jgi:hypothetical protein
LPEEKGRKQQEQTRKERKEKDMPLLGDDMEQAVITGSNLQFSKTRLERLGSTKFTLVTIAVDVTGSTYCFADGLHRALITGIDSCRKSPNSQDLLIRVVLFSSSYSGGVLELHGFKPLDAINTADYEPFNPDGLTPLNDAAFSSIGAMVDYGGELMENDYLANGIVFVITDGMDNQSIHSPGEIQRQISRVSLEEKLESLVTVLIGVNTQEPMVARALQEFRRKSGITQFINMEEVDDGKLAKLGGFISRSVSSTSQALSTGGPSQAIEATI